MRVIPTLKAFSSSDKLYTASLKKCSIVVHNLRKGSESFSPHAKVSKPFCDIVQSYILAT